MIGIFMKRHEYLKYFCGRKLVPAADSNRSKSRFSDYISMKNTLCLFKILRISALALLGQVYAYAQTPAFPALDTLPAPLDSLPEYEIRAFAQHLASQAADIRDLYARQAERSTLEREVAADQLAAAEADTLAAKDERKTLAKILKTNKEAEKAALRQLQKAEKATELAAALLEADSAAVYKNLPKAYKTVAGLLPRPETISEPPIAGVIGAVAVSDPSETPPPVAAEAGLPAAEPATTPEEKKDAKKAGARPVVKPYDPAADVLLRPPPRPCTLRVDTRDEFSGERRRELEKEELLRFTNPSLRAYFPDREHVICQASVAANSGTYVLHLSFTVNDANARRSFGSLPRNSMAVLKFLDGETLTLFNLRADEGKPGDDNASFLFNGQYVIDPGMVKKMQRSLLDKLRIAWATGYEDYDVHNVDFLARQLSCLLKN
jgi:hypothetical protein